MEQKSSNVEMTFWDHVEELRWVIIRSLLGVSIISIVAFLNKNIVFNKVFLAPKEPWFITNRALCKLGELLNSEVLCLNQNNLEIINIKLAGQFTTHLFTSFAVGIFIASPYIIYEFWRFVRPALRPNEKRHSRGAVLISSLLFITGALFAYFLIVPLTINFLGNYQVSEQVSNTIALSSYLSNVVSVSLSVGIIFEVPILIYFLTKTGIVTPIFLRKSRKIIIVVLLVISAIITPPDLISQILVCIPLYFLYELSIRISQRVYRKNFMPAK
ncbi:MAG: twin-arginine translocase subunit TatC [Bacteroidetes bacterium HGW-Bacteroidetes-4]|jgi:sec-independent protein translocase protein TatC|nr:MAG: twin-arginine translocase subunit TatC [Bacteroidetes bacterium HGW-Bacteroidetes-4]